MARYAILILNLLCATAATYADEIAYTNDFEVGAVGTEWSTTITETCPGTIEHPADRFLGRFGAETVTLTLTDLPPHDQIIVHFDLYLINSWDGNADNIQVYGPDAWGLKHSGEVFEDDTDDVTLLWTTFCNGPDSNSQAYPDSYPGGSHPYNTGTCETDTLGYPGGDQGDYGDAIYCFDASNTDHVFSFSHTAPSIKIHFISNQTQGPIDEGWGLDNVVVATRVPLDCNNNGTPDEQEIANYPNLDVNGNGVLDECEVIIEWVTVGDPGNDDDVTGFGGVDDVYRIGKYELTNGEYIHFLNSVAATGDPHGLFKTDMAGALGGIERSGSGTSTSPWVYAEKGGDTSWLSKPVNFVSQADAFRFANWMHNFQPTGAQTTSTTEDGAYDMSLGPLDIVRKPGALVFLPSEDEWYKAAYYNGDDAGPSYWVYPTQANVKPTCEAPAGGTNSANCHCNGHALPSPYVSDVGAYSSSVSAYGTFDQAGNLWERVESRNNAGYATRGGSYEKQCIDPCCDVHGSNTRSWSALHDYGRSGGFRVAAVSEPIPVDCNSNGTSDQDEILADPNLDSNGNGVLDECDVAIDWVTVGDAGNAGELSGHIANDGPQRVCGAVDYAYRIGKYEITNNQYCAFLNAVAAEDPNGLYNANMVGGPFDRGGITQNGTAGAYSYVVRAGRGNHPVNHVGWYDALRFVNWLHNGQPVGGADSFWHLRRIECPPWMVVETRTTEGTQ